MTRLAPEGAFVDLLALPPARQALLLNGEPDRPVAIVISLDELFEDRIDAARRLYRSLVLADAEPSGLSAYRQARLKLALRALDARVEGAGYRELAKAFFPRLLGRDREPSEAVLGRAIRIARYGIRLMRGGYLSLLRPERKVPRRRRTAK